MLESIARRLTRNEVSLLRLEPQVSQEVFQFDRPDAGRESFFLHLAFLGHHVFGLHATFVGAGVSGFSIEDYTGNPAAPLYSISEAVDRLRAARAAISASGEKVLLTARSEAILRQAGGLGEALRRLPAYAEAGADVLYVPLVRTPAEVSEVVRVAGKLPVNVLAGWPGFTKRELEDLCRLVREAMSSGDRKRIEEASSGLNDRLLNYAYLL